MNAHTVLNTPLPSTTGATTAELLAVFDMASTTVDVVIALSNSPRCQGIAEMWADNLIKHLHEIQSAMGAALLKCTDENQMRSVALARHFEWALQQEEAAALLDVVNGLNAKVNGLVAEIQEIDLAGLAGKDGQ